jgi:hypothetical protein
VLCESPFGQRLGGYENEQSSFAGRFYNKQEWFVNS